MIETGAYIYQQYIDKIVKRYDEDFIEGEKVQQYLETLERWENKAKRLSLVKKEKLIFALEELS